MNGAMICATLMLFMVLFVFPGLMAYAFWDSYVRRKDEPWERKKGRGE